MAGWSFPRRCRGRTLRRMTDRKFSGPGDESAEWLNMEDFAGGIDTNRIPRSDNLIGRNVTIELAEGGALTAEFDESTVTWTMSGVE